MARRKKSKSNDIFSYIEFVFASAFFIAILKGYSIKNTFIVTAAALAVIMVIAIIFSIRKKIKLKNSGINTISTMSGITFEKYLKENLKRLGYNKISMTKASGDFGADLIMYQGKDKIVVQAKRYSGSVGIAAVQQVIGAMAYYKADKGMVISNSFYTAAAKKLAKEADVILWDRNDIVDKFKINNDDTPYH